MKYWFRDGSCDGSIHLSNCRFIATTNFVRRKESRWTDKGCRFLL